LRSPIKKEKEKEKEKEKQKLLLNRLWQH